MRYLLLVSIVAGCATTEPYPQPHKGLNGSQITAGFNANRQDVRNCYDAAVKRRVTTGGKITLAFFVQPGGNVTGARATENTTGDSTLERCLVDKLKTWGFPQAEMVSEVKAYPIQLNPPK